MEEKLKVFRSYLRNKGCRPTTVKSYVQDAQGFMSWLSLEGLSVEQLSYGEVLKWIGWQQGKGHKASVINRRLMIVRQLYASLGYESPIEELRLRGQRHKVISGTLKMEILEEVYEEYDKGGLVGKRNKALLGLLIWQGIRRVELELLREEDVDLERSLIRIPETASGNSRILDLEGRQLLALQDYVQLVRPQLNKTGSDRLLLSKSNSGKLANSLSVLIRQVREYNSQVVSATQLRQSVITHWLKHYDLRTVQYMAGHRYVSSTHRYQNRDLENLQERIDELHPLNRL